MTHGFKIIQPDLANGTLELSRIIWKLASKQPRGSLIFMAVMGTFFLIMGLLDKGHHYVQDSSGHKIYTDAWGIGENVGCIFLGMTAFFLYARLMQRRRHFLQVKEMANRARMGLNECTMTLTDTDFHYSSFEYHAEVKWSGFRRYSIHEPWVILYSDFAVFGIDTRLISVDQRSEMLSFLGRTIVPPQTTRQN